ncbi:glycosyltransferase [Proteus mirabilis]|uniref:Gt2 n=3 Tax=Proteus mirabilis TaxID=584 RepID=A0A385JN60_PROMI|nr:MULTISPECIES: glycosyltransferase [Proteus]AXY99728.1 gt2 [Proteus mirabilis]EKV7660988.1 glycosyltransferase [Proteus mirabilis]EKY1725968.1 glycosyltransferase [Proteus mirabilis]ELA9908419.1 glycosyltransferase [Proteus mirabilis]ELA9920148.1 glycosyltransferase [Proteus mirabilis]
MKKIAILVPNLKDNGVSRVAALHSIMFSNQGYLVDIIVEENKSVKFPFSGNLINLNLKRKRGVFKILNFIKLYLKIKKIKTSNKYDFFISHIPHCDIINSITKTKNKEITISTVHNNVELRYSKITKLLLKIIILKKSDAVVTVSEDLASQLKKKYSNYNKIINIPNPVDFNLIKKSLNAQLPEYLSNKKFILNIGRLDSQKGHWHLIKAFYLTLKKQPDLYLVIIGEGPEKIILKNLCKSLNIDKKVIFEGFKENPFIYMNKSSAFVFPSLYEGLPMVLIEAMVCRTPIISSDCFSGPRELLIKDNITYGKLIPNYGTTSSLYTKSIGDYDRLISNEILLLLNCVANKKNLDLAENRAKEFNLENIFLRWKDLFDEYI